MKVNKVLLWAACLLTSVPTFGQPAELAQFIQPPSGSGTADTIVLDATDGKIMFPLPSAPRDFASPADFETFLRQNLNATPIYDDQGNIIGAEGNLIQQGDTYYLDAFNNIQPITEPISAFIGGLGASFTIAGIPYSTGVQGSDIFGPSGGDSPSDVYHCNSSGECVSGHSWVTHRIAYHSVGISIHQETGGYQEHHYFCFRPYPWICVDRSGTNDLILQGTTFSRFSSLVFVYNRFSPTLRHNVTDISLGYWALGFGFPSAAANMVGACGRDSSAAIPSFGATAAGSTLDYECFGGGVTCTPGYSQCPNNVCANLSSDLNNCGGCGVVCPAGPPNSVRTCAAQQCGFACIAGYTRCGGSCVNLASDPDNCGACGHICSSGLCSGGECQSGPACEPCGPADCGVCPPGYFCDGQKGDRACGICQCLQ